MEDGPGGGRGLTSARATFPQPTVGEEVGAVSAASGAAKAVRPARLDEVVSRDDASLIIAVASLAVAVFATATAIYSIRRDRADLRATAADAGAGNRYITIVNVGIRPVRIERVLVQGWRLVWLFGSSRELRAFVIGTDGAERLPVVIAPAADVVINYGAEEYETFVHGRRGELVIEDAAGRQYRVTPSRHFHLGPAD